MPKTRQEKELIIGDVADKFKRMKAAVFTSISGFTMSQADELREKASKQGVEVFIAKKTLLALAAKEAGLDINPHDFTGSILTAVSFDDEVSAAKVLNDLIKTNDGIVFEAGILEGKGLTAAEVKQLASLPSKEQLLGQLVGTLNAPISGFVRVLDGNLRGIVTVLSAIQEKK